MFKPTVVKLIEANKWAEGYHEKNLCSRCEGSSWSTTLHGSPNTGTIQDDLRAFLRSLNPEAAPEKQADGYFQCYCKIRHEYRNFNWFEDDASPLIFNSCDDFVEYEPKDEHERSERPRAGNRERPAPAAKDVAGESPSP